MNPSNIERNIWMELLAIVGLTSWHASYNYYAVKQLHANTIQFSADIKQRDAIIASDIQNIQNINKKSVSYEKQLQLQETDLQDKSKQLQNQRDYINKHNVIERQLLVIVGATNASSSSAKTHESSTSKHISSDTIPAYDYAEWQLGKNKHDDISTITANACIELYNSQYKYINGVE